jgi:hypothetical protein
MLAAALAGPVSAYDAAVHLSREIGSRPAASRPARRAQRYVRSHFRGAGLRTFYVPFAVPGKGRGRNVVGAFDTSANCLDVLVGHLDSVPEGPGANDNASGAGVLVALAYRLDEVKPRCDVWLVATDAEERPYTGAADHLGSLAVVRRLLNKGHRQRFRIAVSLDMVGRGGRFWMRSPHSSPRKRVEGRVLRAARSVGVPVQWVRDSGTGNSDHREFELQGLPAVVIEAWRGSDPCHHEACDRWTRLSRRSLRRARRLAEAVLSSQPTSALGRR